MRVEKKKAFAYRVPIGDYNYLQCNFENEWQNRGIIKFNFFDLNIRICILLMYSYLFGLLGGLYSV